ncbi:MAG: alkaline ceramidase [Alphaproteobacteria bacterium]|nr:alkaline ceramidase [Alphaproteobacteria bacterium]
MSGSRERLRAGVAVVDITPSHGLAMEGFVARSEPANGTHDPLTVRALAVGDSVLATVDAIGLPAPLSARVRAAAPVPAAGVMLHATHTHGGPAALPGQMSTEPDSDWMSRLEAAIGEAIARACADRVPATLSFALAGDPDVARNRRHADGSVDKTLPVLHVDRVDGAPLAVLVNYACHPVALGADNRLWTADYAHFVRTEVEVATGATALFVTGCAGDLNTGHSAAASVTLAASEERSFASAERHGRRIAHTALAAAPSRIGAGVDARESWIDLPLARTETEPSEALARRWATEADATSDPVRARLIGIWARWAADIAPRDLRPIRVRVSWLDWGGLRLIGMPGEIFAATALGIRADLAGPAILAGFCESNPGYFPPREEFEHGGYEVEEAHRYYGLPAAFAPGAAEAIGDAVRALDTQ